MPKPRSRRSPASLNASSMRTDETPGETERGEQSLTGIGVSPGIAIGTAFVAERDELNVEERSLSEAEIEPERARFAEAVAASTAQLRRLKLRAAALPDSAAEEIGFLLDAHLAMLSNSRLVRGVDQRIQRSRINAERAVQLEIAELGESFARMRDRYLAARVEDIRIVGGRLIRNLARRPFAAYASLGDGAIILAEEIAPADTALMDPQRIGGFAAEFGGQESHTAIMARALGLPDLLARARSGATVVIDGEAGLVVIDPTPETVAEYRQRHDEFARARRS